jgi:uncharacterized protein
MKQIARAFFGGIALAIVLTCSVGSEAASPYGDLIPVSPDGNLDDAQAADERGDYVTAFGMYRKLAESGIVGAQTIVGMDYENGKGVPQSFEDAAKWYRRAAEQGEVYAQLMLGILYARGKGVEHDPEQSAKWLRRAAEQGEPRAQSRLGSQYELGEGVPKSIEEAAHWYQRAAEQGDARGQWNLGLLYANGSGVIQDYVVAYKWLNLAVAKITLDNEAPILIKTFTRSRDYVARLMTKQQIAEAQKLAREWKPSSKP